MDYGKLSYAIEGSPPQTIMLRPGVTTLGSAPENDVVLDAQGVSPYHTRLICTADDCWVMDLDSAEGTFLNQVRLRPLARYPLRDGDILRIGPYFVRYSGGSKSDDDLGGLLKGIVKEIAPHRKQQVLPPEVAARLSRVGAPPTRSVRRLPARQLRGSGGPPRIPFVGLYRDGMSSYTQYLPPCYQDDPFMGRFLMIFEAILDPLERMLDEIHRYFDPQLAPERMLPWLASWVDLVLNEKWPLERRRALVAAAAELYRWRGTRHGLSEYIRIYTGITPTIIEADPQSASNGAPALPPHVFQVILEVPDAASVERELVEVIIETQKPAHTGYILEIRTLEPAPVSVAQ